MKKYIFLIIAFFTISLILHSQNVVKEGKTFTQITKSSKKESTDIKTEYIYKDSKGIEYPVYLSSTGKAYIKKVSKKTGKEYKQYVPEIGKQINPEAYKDKK